MTDDERDNYSQVSGLLVTFLSFGSKYPMRENPLYCRTLFATKN